MDREQEVQRVLDEVFCVVGRNLEDWTYLLALFSRLRALLCEESVRARQSARRRENLNQLRVIKGGKDGGDLGD